MNISYLLPTLNTSGNSTDAVSMITLYKNSCKKPISIKTHIKQKFINNSLNKSKQLFSTIDTTNMSTKISSKTLIALNNNKSELKEKLNKLESLYELCQQEEKNILDLNKTILVDIKNKQFSPYDKAMNRHIIKEQIRLHNSKEESDSILLNTKFMAQNIQKKKIIVRKLQPICIKEELFRSTKLNENSLFKFRNLIKEKVGGFEEFEYKPVVRANVPTIDFSDPSSIIYESKKIAVMEKMAQIKKQLPKIKPKKIKQQQTL
jgi:hypothetical protein